MSQAPQQSPWQAQSAALQMQQLGMMSEQMSLISAMNGLLATLNQGFLALTRAIIENTRMMGKLALSPAIARNQMMGVANPYVGQGITVPLVTRYQSFESFMTKQEADLLGPIKALLQYNVQGKISGSSGGTTQGPFSKHGSLMGDPASILKSMLPETIRGIWGATKGGAQAFGFGKGGGATAGLIGLGEGFGRLKENLKGMWSGGLFAGAGKQAKGFAAPFSDALKSLGPQMAMMAIVMAPVQALLEGLFAPFEILTDIFGAYGEILGQMFIPIIMAIQPILLSFLPILQAIAPMLGQVILLIFQFMTPIGLILPLLEAVMPFLTIAITAVSGVIEQVVAFFNVFSPLDLLFAGVNVVILFFMDIFNTFANGLATTGNALASFFTFITDGFWNMINGVVNLFSGIGTTIAEILGDVWTEIITLGTAKTKWFG